MIEFDSGFAKEKGLNQAQLEHLLRYMVMTDRITAYEPNQHATPATGFRLFFADYPKTTDTVVYLTIGQAELKELNARLNSIHKAVEAPAYFSEEQTALLAKIQLVVEEELANRELHRSRNHALDLSSLVARRDIDYFPVLDVLMVSRTICSWNVDSIDDYFRVFLSQEDLGKSGLLQADYSTLEASRERIKKRESGSKQQTQV